MTTYALLKMNSKQQDCKALEKKINSQISDIVRNNNYIGIRDQDGWETLELTVRSNHSKLVAIKIIEMLEA